MKPEINITITLHSYRVATKGGITKARHEILQAIIESQPSHRMDCGRVVVISQNALNNLEKHKTEFVDYLKKNIYDDVVIKNITWVDNLERNLPQLVSG